MCCLSMSMLLLFAFVCFFLCRVKLPPAYYETYIVNKKAKRPPHGQMIALKDHVITINISFLLSFFFSMFDILFE